MSEPPARRSDGEDWFEAGAWLEAPTEEQTPARRTRPRRWKASRLVLASVLAVVAVVLVALALALAGVFSNGDEAARPQAVEPVPPPPPATTNRQPSPPLPAGARIAAGEEGRQVRLLQRALAELGYKPGRVDGKFGMKTRQALERFQRKAGLEPDGIAGAKTLRALNQALIRARS